MNRLLKACLRALCQGLFGRSGGTIDVALLYKCVGLGVLPAGERDIIIHTNMTVGRACINISYRYVATWTCNQGMSGNSGRAKGCQVRSFVIGELNVVVVGEDNPCWECLRVVCAIGKGNSPGCIGSRIGARTCSHLRLRL